MPIKDNTIAFIGGGNMARSLIGGLLAANVDPSRIRVSDPDPKQLELLSKRFSIQASEDNAAAIDGADIIVLAVKPQVIHPVAEELAERIQTDKPLVISIAAGVRESDLQRWLGGNVALVRTMPNTPALVQCGATVLFARDQVNADQRELAESILRAVGLTLWVKEESDMDAVTALSGSGPAYFFLLIEMLEQAGMKLGLSPDAVRLLATQTAFGAAKMALESTEDAATLRERVTSPGGTTERALSIMEEADIRELIQQALTGARDRSIELAEQLGKL